MKKTIYLAAALLIIFCMYACFSMAALAENATAHTYTPFSENGLVRTQNAYLTGEILFKDALLRGAEDICVRGNYIYIADTQNGRIVSYCRETGEYKEYGKDILNTPTGVFVTDDGEMYVADRGFSKVFHLTNEGTLIKEFSRPKTKTFGKETNYKPEKVRVDKAGIIYIVSEGSFDGMIQLDQSGEFLGYFGVNNVPFSALNALQDLIFTKEQKAKLFGKTPLSFCNLDMNSQGLVYSVTKGVKGNALKKHDISGSDLMESSMIDEDNFTAVAVGNYGQIIAVTETGLLFEYDNDGNLLFTLGGRAVSGERNGLFTVVSAAALDDNDFIYILDKERNVVHSFIPTDFTILLHNSLKLYNEGRYHESLSGFKALLQQSGDVSMVHNGLARNQMQMQNYESAAAHFKLSNNKEGYSEAFWEIRNEKMGNIIPLIIFLVPAAVVLWIVFRITAKKRSSQKADKSGESALVCQIKFSLRFLKHPFDNFYEVKMGRGGSVISASVLYMIALSAFLFDCFGRGFALSSQSFKDIGGLYTAALFAVLAGLFVLCSYMVSEVGSGEGRFVQMYIGGAYAFVPMVVIMPAATLLSRVLTLNDRFVVDFSLFCAYVWVGVLMVILIKQIHNYEFSQVFVNLAFTFLLMIVMLLLVSVLVLFWDKLADIITSIVREVKYRAG